MRRAPVAAILVLAIAPTAHAAEAKVTVTGGAGAPIAAPATYAEPAANVSVPSVPPSLWGLHCAIVLPRQPAKISCASR